MKSKFALFVFAATQFGFGLTAFAANGTWSGASSGAWLTAGNWSATPGSSSTTTNTDWAAFNNATQPTVGINMNTTGGVYYLGALDYNNGTARTINNSSGTVSGVLTLNGTTLNSISNTIIYNRGSGNLTVTNGASTMGLALGNATVNNVIIDGSGNVTIGSNITGASRKLGVLGAGSGDLILTGTNSFTGGIDISGSGKLRLGATAALSTTGNMAISGDGRLRFGVAGTYGSSSQNLTINSTGTTNAAIDLQASNIAVTLNHNVALSADARIESNGATGALTLAGNLSGSGTLVKQAAGNLILSGTGNTATGGTQVGNGTVTVNSGSKLGTGDLTLAQTSTNNTAVVLNNATQSIGNLSSSWTAVSGSQTQKLTLNGTALTVNQTSNGTFGTGAVSTLTSTIEGTGSLVKAGSATLTLTGTHTYTGTTTVNDGKLVINGNISTSVTTVNDGGTLSGSGTVGAVTVGFGGTLAPGNSPGILSAGATNLQLGSTLGIEIDGTTIGTQYDQLNVTGTVTLAGLLAVTTSVAPADNALFFILANDGADAISGRFSNAAIDGEIYKFGSQDYRISYFGNYLGGGTGDFTGGNDIVLMAVPEPAAALLGALGLLTILRRRR